MAGKRPGHGGVPRVTAVLDACRLRGVVTWHAGKPFSDFTPALRHGCRLPYVGGCVVAPTGAGVSAPHQPPAPSNAASSARSLPHERRAVLVL